MNAMSHRGYHARIEFDSDDEIFVGHVAGIDDIVGFHADTVRDLKIAFHEAVDDYVRSCEAIGRTPNKPYSGRVMFRLTPDLHAQAAVAARISGKSLNQWAEEALREAVKRNASVA